MFPLQNIREHVTEQLDTSVTVFRKFRDSSGVIRIKEVNKSDNDNRTSLEEIRVINIPNNNVWIFENEFRYEGGNELIKNQSDAFVSSGKKVEKTILYHQGNKLFIIMVEMKKTISPKKYNDDIIKKFESSLAILSVFIAAHSDISLLKDSKIFPIGVCCYNYYEDNKPNANNDPKHQTAIFRNSYNQGKKELLLSISPLTLNIMAIPVLLFENPNNPITTGFEINLQDILDRVDNI